MIERKIYGSRMLLDPKDPGLSRQLLKKGTREGDCPKILEKLVKPDWVCIDLGASLGFYALIEGKKGAKVYAIEASPKNAEMLRRSVELNDYDIEVFNFAAGNKNGTAVFTISNYSNLGFMKHMVGFRDRSIGIKDIKIKEQRLDDFIEEHRIRHLDFLRFDIDGYEVEMIQGAQNTLKMMRVDSWIFAELHPRCFHKPYKEYKPTLENIISHGFVPKKVIGPARELSKVNTQDFIHLCCTKYAPTAPLVFFQKCV